MQSRRADTSMIVVSLSKAWYRGDGIVIYMLSDEK